MLSLSFGGVLIETYDEQQRATHLDDDAGNAELLISTEPIGSVSECPFVCRGIC